MWCLTRQVKGSSTARYLEVKDLHGLSATSIMRRNGNVLTKGRLI
jgi:hypothetical protein